MQVVLTGQGRNFCAGIDFSALEVVTHVLDAGCPGRARERLLRSIQRWQVLLAEPQQAEQTKFQRCKPQYHVCEIKEQSGALMHPNTWLQVAYTIWLFTLSLTSLRVAHCAIQT